MSKIVVEYIGEIGETSILVHGGAGSWRIEEGENYIDMVTRFMRHAAESGYGVLQAGSALDAVVKAIMVLENSGVFNAGIGSTLNYFGEVEMDAGLMSGDGRVGGVAATSYPRNPILLARYVLENLDHVMIAGKGADILAERIGLEKHPGPVKRVLERWRKARERLQESRKPKWALQVSLIYADTVGAVAVKDETVAAGASTGGILLKHPGRVGDSPIPGGGYYAKNHVGACSATGIGEFIILTLPCMYAVKLLEENVPVEDAARTAVARTTRIYGADNLGLILVDAKGRAAAAMNTAAMPISFAGSSAQPKTLIIKRE